MANKSVFNRTFGEMIPASDCVNEAGGKAYAFTPKHQLAQYAATGCMNETFYATAEEQLETVLLLCEEVEPSFIARTAVYCREQGYMKDMPALLCAVLSVKAPGLLIKIFDRVINNGKMMRNFVQIMRSGVVGRKSLGSMPKRLVRQWLESRSVEAIFRASVGQSPSIADIVKMVHPKPSNEQREALYGYLIRRDYDADKLPELVQRYEAFKADNGHVVPDVPFQMLTGLALSDKQWAMIACNAGWQMTRMNLNTFARHGVFRRSGLFKRNKLVKQIANRLRNPALIRKAQAFPYQLLIALKMTGTDIPHEIREALHDAMEVATENVPRINGQIYVCPDVSGSMVYSSVTGQRAGSTSAVRCIDVAALVTASIVRKNRHAKVMPFENRVHTVRLNGRDSIMTNAEKLAKIGGGGTNCSAPLAELNQRKAKGDLVIYISDNESWIDTDHGCATATMREWQKFKSRNSQAKMVCIDIQPYGSGQVTDRQDILNIGGFSDRVFDVISAFASGTLQANHWIGVIEDVEI